MSLLESLEIPKFENYTLIPRNPTCIPINSTRLWVEILGGLNNATTEFKDSELSSKILIDGEYSLVIRYKREKDGIWHPACTLSFNQDIRGNICLNQLQGSTDKIAFRFYSSFNNLSFYLKLLEDSFTKKGIYIYVKNFPTGINSSSNPTDTFNAYEKLRIGIMDLNKRYLLNCNIDNEFKYL